MSNVLTIQRSKWTRGGNRGITVLLDDGGFMCCLGFDALACGLSSDQILGRRNPAEVIAGEETVPASYRKVRMDARGYSHSVAVNQAISDNDDPNIDDARRERWIREDLIALGWDDVVFVD